LFVLNDTIEEPRAPAVKPGHIGSGARGGQEVKGGIAGRDRGRERGRTSEKERVEEEGGREGKGRESGREKRRKKIKTGPKLPPDRGRERGRTSEKEMVEEEGEREGRGSEERRAAKERKRERKNCNRAKKGNFFKIAPSRGWRKREEWKEEGGRTLRFDLSQGAGHALFLEELGITWGLRRRPRTGSASPYSRYCLSSIYMSKTFPGI
jgi:hypothetical protein